MQSASRVSPPRRHPTCAGARAVVLEQGVISAKGLGLDKAVKLRQHHGVCGRKGRSMHLAVTVHAALGAAARQQAPRAVAAERRRRGSPAACPSREESEAAVVNHASLTHTRTKTHACPSPTLPRHPTSIQAERIVAHARDAGEKVPVGRRQAASREPQCVSRT